MGRVRVVVRRILSKKDDAWPGYCVLGWMVDGGWRMEDEDGGEQKGSFGSEVDAKIF